MSDQERKSAMIELQNISVRYRLIKERPKTFQEHAINFLKGKKSQAETFHALRGVSFSVDSGQCLGIIGHNGAGKSTLLKVISSVIKPAEGKVTVNGTIAPLIEISAGFDYELTGRENIFLNTSILGFSRKEIEAKYSEIVAFTELEDFMNSPLKNFSSGMVARLGFSIATAVDPDILIVDEVLAVGDAYFKKKSEQKIREFKKKGVTILFVSHNTEYIKDLCDTVLWLDHGMMKMMDSPRSVIDEYQASLKNTGNKKSQKSLF